jgi:hypothetical protein
MTTNAQLDATFDLAGLVADVAAIPDAPMVPWADGVSGLWPNERAYLSLILTTVGKLATIFTETADRPLTGRIVKALYLAAIPKLGEYPNAQLAGVEIIEARMGQKGGK